MGNNLESMKISWYPGFYGAMEIELSGDKGLFEFEKEYNLSKEPLRIDLLIIKKLSKKPIIGYACLYKGLGERVGRIPAEELTISIFRDTYPRELFQALKRMEFAAEECFPGIYYLRGQILFDTQTVVTSCLRGNVHRSLRMLSRKVKEEDAKAFIKSAALLKDPGDRNNVEAVLQETAGYLVKKHSRI